MFKELIVFIFILIPLCLAQIICKKKALVSKSFIETYYFTYYKTHETSCYMGLLKCYEKQYHQDLSWRLAKRNVFKELDICCAGYEQDYTRTTASQLFCNPICDEECVNGACLSPGNCKCLDGYHPITATRCEPSCINCNPGKCTAPNKCECYQGYERKDNRCQPTCESCINGDCIGRNTCECHKGFYKNESGQCVKLEAKECQVGYILEDDKCVPYCELCTHGVCIAPNQCECYSGYMKALDMCIPFCENGCPKGECVAPNECQCKYGYELRGNICSPICNDCEFGECTEPGVCKCLSGYEKDIFEKCIPVCTRECPEHSTCIAPSSCKCDTGYELQSAVCRPVCDKCVNGVCTAPGVCKCEYGRILDESGHCGVPCQNCKGGTCSLDGTCSCADGFLYNINSDPNCISFGTIQRENLGENAIITTVTEEECEDCFLSTVPYQPQEKEDLYVFLAPMILLVGMTIIVVTLYIIKATQKHSEDKLTRVRILTGAFNKI